ncbi:MAG: preprotein translocase subunit SecG [Clostridiales bacterium]|jgi:preprotein translocase subunit SecG|nr:preprotein translocase subunit SecG [Clostridiales bacterium]MDR2713755.1 preprotein translocase subunit SecG [Clostridiales bacterium]
MPNIVHMILVVLQILVSLGLISTVLLQSGKSAGLSGSIAGGAEAIFGKKKGLDELLSKISTVLASAFLLLTLLLAVIR